MVHKHAAEIALTPGKLLYMLYMWGLIRDFPVVSCMVVTLSNQQPPSQRAVNLLPSKSEKRCSVELSVIWTGAVLLPVVTMPGLHISEVQVAGANDCAMCQPAYFSGNYHVSKDCNRHPVAPQWLGFMFILF